MGSRIDRALERVPELQDFTARLARGLHNAVLRGGKPTRKIADALHGTWLGHPLHPVLTDVVVGAWSLTALFDALSLVRGSHSAAKAADVLAVTGVAAAIPTALSGAADYSTLQRDALPAATVHAAMNKVSLLLYMLSVRDRRRGHRGRGIALATLGLALSGGSAWLGGHMVYTLGAGINRNADVDGPDDWTPVADADALADGLPLRTEAAGTPVLLIRQGGRLYAIGARCGHAGGPLDEGEFCDGTVRCPWHDSVFALDTGDVVHGPATTAQPLFETRVSDGRIEVRLHRK